MKNIKILLVGMLVLLAGCQKDVGRDALGGVALDGVAESSAAPAQLHV